MKSDRQDKKSADRKSEVTRVELKYCEHCGGLWLRECGAGQVYCHNCLPKVEDLPIPKKRPGRLTLPVQPRTVVEQFGHEQSDDGMDFEAAGGVA